jgi:hypothetical protein
VRIRVLHCYWTELFIIGKISYHGFHGFHGWETNSFLSVSSVKSVVDFLVAAGRAVPFPPFRSCSLIHEGCDGSQTRINTASESRLIKVNQSQSRLIKANNIVLHGRLEKRRRAAPAGAKPSLSLTRLVARPCMQKLIGGLAADSFGKLLASLNGFCYP